MVSARIISDSLVRPATRSGLPNHRTLGYLSQRAVQGSGAWSTPHTEQNHDLRYYRIGLRERFGVRCQATVLDDCYGRLPRAMALRIMSSLFVQGARATLCSLPAQIKDECGW